MASTECWAAGPSDTLKHKRGVWGRVRGQPLSSTSLVPAWLDGSSSPQRPSLKQEDVENILPTPLISHLWHHHCPIQIFLKYKSNHQNTDLEFFFKTATTKPLKQENSGRKCLRLRLVFYLIWILISFSLFLDKIIAFNCIKLHVKIAHRA